MVKREGLIPLREPNFPKSFAGLFTDVVEGDIKLCGNPSAQALGYDESAAFVGARSDAGSFGGVVEKDGSHYGVTCKHVVGLDKTVCCPAWKDRDYVHGFKKFCEMDVVDAPELGTMFIDASGLRYSLDAALLSDKTNALLARSTKLPFSLVNMPMLTRKSCLHKMDLGMTS